MTMPPDQRHSDEPPVLDYRLVPVCAPGDCWTGQNTAWLIGICIALLLLIGYMARPSISGSEERGNRVRCSSHLRQIGQGVALYRSVHRVWPQSLAQIMVDTELSAKCFVCPSSGAKPAGGATVREMAQALTNPKHCSFIYFPPPPDAGDLSPDAILAIERMENHEGEGMNVLFADGYVEWHDRRTSQHVIDELRTGHNPPRKPATRPSTGGN
jgi:prepilin-type processing-associated H-X9-DG protein